MDDHEWTIDYAEQLIAEWRQRADRYEADGVESHARLLRSNADELERARDAALGEPLTVAAAAVLSGYSTQHLKKLLHDGAIPNVGKPGAPRIRRGDVPRRAGHGVMPLVRVHHGKKNTGAVGEPSLAAIRLGA